MLVTSVWLIYSNHNLQDNHVYTFLRRNLCRTITLDYIKLGWVHLINRQVQLGCNLCVLETGYKCLWMRLFGLFIILCARIYSHGCFQESVLITLVFWHFNAWFGRLLHIISTLKQHFFFFVTYPQGSRFIYWVFCHLSDITESLCVCHLVWSCDSTLHTFHIIKTKQSFLSFVLFLNISCLHALFGRQRYVCIKGVTKHA